MPRRPARILDWGMRAFEKSDIFAAGTLIGEARLYGGERRSVPPPRQWSGLDLSCRRWAETG